jgi:phage shock protein C
MNTPTSTPTDGDSTRSPLRRPTHDRMIAGVAAGIADYFDVDVTVVRIAIAVLSVFGGAGIALYIAGWLLMPEEGSERSIANRLTRTGRACSQS